MQLHFVGSRIAFVYMTLKLTKEQRKTPSCCAHAKWEELFFLHRVERKPKCWRWLVTVEVTVAVLLLRSKSQSRSCCYGQSHSRGPAATVKVTVAVLLLDFSTWLTKAVVMALSSGLYGRLTGLITVTGHIPAHSLCMRNVCSLISELKWYFWQAMHYYVQATWISWRRSQAHMHIWLVFSRHGFPSHGTHKRLHARPRLLKRGSHALRLDIRRKALAGQPTSDFCTDMWTPSRLLKLHRLLQLCMLFESSHTWALAISSHIWALTTGVGKTWRADALVTFMSTESCRIPAEWHLALARRCVNPETARVFGSYDGALHWTSRECNFASSYVQAAAWKPGNDVMPRLVEWTTEGLRIGRRHSWTWCRCKGRFLHAKTKGTRVSWVTPRVTSHYAWLMSHYACFD
jgi:hypothetical protein